MTATTLPLIQSLAEPSKRAILEHLRQGPKSVNELVSLTGLSQPNVSNHLARLRSMKLVGVTQSGRTRTYHLATALPAAATVRTPERPWTPSELRDASKKLTQALVNREQTKATLLVHEALSTGVSLIDLYGQLLEPALSHLGDLWEKGKITEAEEHLGTNLIERLMAGAAISVPNAAPTGRKAVAGAVAGNQHVLGLRMICDVLQQQGWEVRYLGADVPTDSFAKMVESERPDLVLVTCAMKEQEADLRKLCDLIKLGSHKPRIAVGGGAFNRNPGLVAGTTPYLFSHHIQGFLKSIGTGA